jgi:hypothetical protein
VRASEHDASLVRPSKLAATSCAPLDYDSGVPDLVARYRRSAALGALGIVAVATVTLAGYRLHADSDAMPA